MDVSLEGHGLPLDATALQRLCGVSVGHLIDRAFGLGADGDEDIDDETERANAVEQILEAVASATPVGWEESEWRDFSPV